MYSRQVPLEYNGYIFSFLCFFFLLLIGFLLGKWPCQRYICSNYMSTYVTYETLYRDRLTHAPLADHSSDFELRELLIEKFNLIRN